jgi:flagellar basal body rod protein FlgF
MFHMARVIGLTALTFVLFMLGLLTGAGIPTGWTRGTLATPVPVPPLPEAAAAEFEAVPGTAVPVQPASFSADEREQAQRSAEQRIRNVFPEADSEMVAVWAETLRDLSGREQEELLQQRRLMSGSLNSLFSRSLRSPDTALPPLAAEASGSGRIVSGGSRPTVPPMTAESEVAAVKATGAVPAKVDERTGVLQNLRNLRSIGYRAILNSPAEAAGETVRIFEPGRRVRTSCVLCCSLPDDPQLWFQLRDGQLTRRGDLQISAEGMPGFRDGTDFRALAGTWQVTASERLQISQQGELLGGVDPASAEGNRRSFGRLPVVRVSELGGLTTGDGVFFRIPEGVQVELVAADDIQVSPGTLELSNVDVMEEQVLLNSLSAQ